MREPRPRRTWRAGEQDLERELEVLARLMDSLFRIPGLGWRFGLDPVLGLVPVVGDLVGTAVAVYILLAGLRYGVPKITLIRMGMNTALDMIVGAVPFVGDLFDAYWKSNTRNLMLLQQRVRTAGRRGADLSDWLFVGLIVAMLLGLLLAGIALIGWLVGTLIGAFRG
jgi:hypothetical protein